MKNVTKLFSLLLALALVLSLAACGDGKKPDSTDTNSSSVECSEVEFKYSTDYMNWTAISTGTEMFKPDGSYTAGEIEVFYINVKNLSDKKSYYTVSISVNGNAGDVTVGVIEAVRSKFKDSQAALSEFGDGAKPLTTGSLIAAYLEADSATTYAVVIHASAATEKLSLKLKTAALRVGGTGKNTSEKSDGKTLVYADTYKIVDSVAEDTVLANGDTSFAATFKAGTVKDGELLAASVAPAETDGAYSITLKLNGVDITAVNPVSISLLAGYGLEGVKVTFNSAEIASTYSKYSGRVEFEITANGTYTVSYSGKTELSGVAVGTANKTFNTLKEAISFVQSQPSSEVPETIEFVIFGKSMYLVEEGEVISFVGNHSHVKNINITGGDAAAELVIDKNSGSLPSLPIADKGMKITYSGLTFDSEKTDGIKHFDYRGDADISLLECTFKQAIANRGAYSNVVVDGCVFACKTFEDTFKGYCYYTVPIVGCNRITVSFTNNQVTENWGGINMDWSLGDIYIANNTFANIDCSKPAIQLSRATTMKIENNTFTNITNENVFRFYADYGAGQTEIINNEIDADYIFQSDKEGDINNLSNFTFAGNIISSTTDLENGHVANSTADDVKPHGYVIDTNLNTIQ